MRYSSIVVAAFLALASGITAAPIDARGQSYGPAKSVLSGNKDNGIVAFSGNGGAGGSNSASGVAWSDASSKNTKVKGAKVITSASSGNKVIQYADGGDGSAVGTYGSDNEFHRRDLDERDFEERGRSGSLVYVAPDVDVLSNNDDNGIVIGSGNGGAGGTNIAFGKATSSSKSNNKGVKGGKIITSSESGNAIGQSADGGDGSAVGTYGSKNKFYSREVEERTNKPAGSFKFLSDNDGNGVVIGSGNGGKGGNNVAIGKASSDATSTNKWVKGGKIVTVSSAGNEIGQSADGGDGSAVGSYGSGNKFYIRDVEDRDFEERGYTPPTIKYLSDNSGNGIVYGSGNGGKGGSNSAHADADSSSTSTNKWVKGGKIVVISSAGNEIGQSADGGDGNAVGSYGSHNKFGA